MPGIDCPRQRQAFEEQAGLGGAVLHRAGEGCGRRTGVVVAPQLGGHQPGEVGGPQPLARPQCEAGAEAVVADRRVIRHRAHDRPAGAGEGDRHGRADQHRLHPRLPQEAVHQPLGHGVLGDLGGPVVTGQERIAGPTPAARHAPAAGADPGQQRAEDELGRPGGGVEQLALGHLGRRRREVDARPGGPHDVAEAAPYPVLVDAVGGAEGVADGPERHLKGQRLEPAEQLLGALRPQAVGRAGLHVVAGIGQPGLGQPRPVEADGVEVPQHHAGHPARLAGQHGVLAVQLRHEPQPEAGQRHLADDPGHVVEGGQRRGR